MPAASARFPVVCPVCGGEALAVFPIAELRARLVADEELPLRSPCHGRTWNADKLEREQMMQYLEAVECVQIA